MSWSITLIGKPENLTKALEDHATKLTGLSKEEYEAALPHLVGLVGQNISNTPNMLKVTANGSGSKNGDVVYRNCTASIETWYGTIV